MPPLPGDVQWFPAEIRRLIVAIKKCEGLYNPRHDNFGLREIQARSWKQVAEQVGGGKTDTQCRDKWNCLRGTYRRHVRTEITNNVRRRSGWPWADMMSFIKVYVQEREDADLLENAKYNALNGKKSPPLAQVTNPKPVKPGTTHSPHCPMTNKFAKVNAVISNPNVTKGLTLAGGIYGGGIIFNTNRVGIGIVQPNQTNLPIGILQSAQSGVGMVQPTQTAVSVNQTQPNIAMGIVQPTTKSEDVIVVQSGDKDVRICVGNSVKSTAKAHGKKTLDPDPINVDLSKVKREPGGRPDSPAFVDMDIPMKKEPMDEEELNLTEFNFLPEDSSQESTQDDERNSGPNHRHSPGPVSDESNCDSNQLFMRSIVTHLRSLSPYDQSVFKLKVQQLLHEMMFPKDAIQATKP